MQNKLSTEMIGRLFSLSLSRSLIRCVGAKTETSQFLQGMITNDMNQIAKESSCIYALFLNKLGRVLYDSIIYKVPTNDETKDSFLIECDSSISNNLVKHLKLYRVRRKIDITLSDEHDLWCLDGSNCETKTSESVATFNDPRLKDLGKRLITPKSFKVKEHLSNVQEGSAEDYAIHRYKLGICEGVVDLLPEKSFPLEANCDYMNGISFQKGCYIGQELTARTHHTGVVRKRLMPLIFEKPISFKLDEQVEVKDEANKSVGKVRNVVGQHGLGLLRIDQAIAATQLSLNENKFRTHRPEWWPKAAEIKIN